MKTFKVTIPVVEKGTLLLPTGEYLSSHSFGGSLTDKELEACRTALPAYKNDMTLEQIAEANAIYKEQRRRYDKTIEEYNREATKETGLKHGDKVKQFASGFGGLVGGQEYTGKVIYDRNGRLAIRTKIADGSGRRTFSINKGWKKVGA